MIRDQSNTSGSQEATNTRVKLPTATVLTRDTAAGIWFDPELVERAGFIDFSPMSQPQIWRPRCQANYGVSSQAEIGFSLMEPSLSKFCSCLMYLCYNLII